MMKIQTLSRHSTIKIQTLSRHGTIEMRRATVIMKVTWYNSTIAGLLVEWCHHDISERTGWKK